MSITPEILQKMLPAVSDVIDRNADQITELDQAIGDGDHLFNLQRGLHALVSQAADLSQKESWSGAWRSIGMTMMSTVGGASGSLYGTMFVAMSKAAVDRHIDLAVFADAFAQGVESIKLRGKSDAGEKTMLDVLIPVANYLQDAAEKSTELSEILDTIPEIAEAGVEATRDMVATKGRASFLGERAVGHIDAGAKTMQLMICASVDVIKKSASPA